MHKLSMQLGVLMFITGCSTFDSDIDQMRVQAEQCTGVVKLEAVKTDKRERVRFVCEWVNEEEVL